nr:inositol monophosphatase family protein [Kribbella shirazensis]
MDELLSVASQAVDIAGQRAFSQAPGLITPKGDRDMASEVDYAVEKELRAFLAEETPDIGFLGEEEGRSVGRRDELLWVLDPIDGTANFVRGLPLVAVSLGLVGGDSSLLGIIDMPFLRRRYAGRLRGGATCNGRPIRGSRCDRLDDAMIAIGDYAVGDRAPAKNAPRLALTALLAARVQRVRMLGTAATDLAWTAHGQLDASIMFSNKPWDTSAGVLIAREAGLQVLDLDGSQHKFHSKGTVAVAEPIADQLLALIAEAQELDELPSD